MILIFQFFYSIFNNCIDNHFNRNCFTFRFNSKNEQIQNNFYKPSQVDSKQVQATLFYNLNNLNKLQFHIFCNGAICSLLKSSLHKYSILILLDQPIPVSKSFLINSSNFHIFSFLYFPFIQAYLPFKESMQLFHFKNFRYQV